MNNRSFYYALLISTIIVSLAASAGVNGQDIQRKPLDHSVYDDWKTISDHKISNDGMFVSYEVNPLVGDGKLYLYDVASGKSQVFERGYQSRISHNAGFMAFKIKPQHQKIRQAKKEKKNKKDWPVDSLGIVLTGTHKVMKFERVKSFTVPEKGSSWMVIHHFPPPDTAGSDTIRKNIKKGELLLIDPVNKLSHNFSSVSDYVFSENGKLLAFIRAPVDSAREVSVSFFDLETRQEAVILEGPGRLEQLAVDAAGEKIAVLQHHDTARVVGYNLYLHQRGQGSEKIVDSVSTGMPEGWGISRHGRLWFSEDGSRLFFGTAEVPEEEPEDTLLREEKYLLDVWSWTDDLLQPMQKARLKEEKRRNHLACYDFERQRMFQLGNEKMESVRTMFRGEGRYALGSSSKPYHKWISWKGGRYRDYYLINLENGSAEELLRTKNGPVSLSPGGSYILWYETADSNWYSHDTETEQLTCLTGGLSVPFYRETHDRPMDPYPYGVGGWTKNDEYVMIYDRYDIWKLDPAGKQLPMNLTNSHGRKTHTVYRIEKLDDEVSYIPTDRELLLRGYNDDTKESGYYTSSPHLKQDPEVLIQGPYDYRSLSQARDDETVIYRRGSFSEYPDVWISDPGFRRAKQISGANPQAAEYYWGTPQLVHWTSFSGEKLDGILYTPEHFEPEKKYPMLVYFYERSSQRLYRHRTPAPSASTINIPLYVSNGYVVFVPDITYRTGYPGASAYDAVVSGAMAMVQQFGYIDEQNMGIQGQSWGGYQVAYLVTRTDLFKAAMAGAPVSNMTSAYGGIRWGSGMSRMFQYEQTQSRIGGTLWEKTPLYLENSPLFHAPRVNTPLLMMHNDNDGAVPWYQGIEFFVALRRLNKPSWLLVYNNEAHNLRKIPNKKDLSVRMMQFFDHYLKGAPAPVWMTEGIPAIKKGIDSGYELND